MNTSCVDGVDGDGVDRRSELDVGSLGDGLNARCATTIVEGRVTELVVGIVAPATYSEVGKEAADVARAGYLHRGDCVDKGNEGEGVEVANIVANGYGGVMT